jgi:hypothetical protein
MQISNLTATGNQVGDMATGMTRPHQFANSPFVGGITIEYEVSGNTGGGNTIICQGFISIDPNQIGKLPGTGKSNGPEKDGMNSVSMTVVPNPALAAAQVQYAVDDIPGFKDGTIKLYNLSGALVQAQKVRGTKGQTRFDINGHAFGHVSDLIFDLIQNLASGTYVVVFFNQSQRLGQQIIIKE